MTAWVLLVAPDGPAQRAQREDLERAGFVVEVASTVEAALGSLLVISPSRIVVDAGFGDEALRRLADAVQRMPNPGDVSTVELATMHPSALTAPRTGAAKG